MSSSPAMRTTLVAAVAAGAPLLATAGPWTLEQGAGQAILGFEYRDDQTDVDANGDDADGRRRQAVASFSSEFGLTDAVTFGFRSEARWSEIDSDGADRDNAGFTEGAAWVRTRLWSGGGAVVSAQAGGEVATGYDPDLRPELGDGASGFELRGLAGYGTGSLIGNAWFGAETAYLARNRNAVDQVKIDITAGVRPEAAPDVLLMLQGFGTVAAGNGDRSDFDTLKLAPSIAYEATDSMTVRLGATREVYTRGVDAGTAVTLDLWFDF